MQVHTIVHKQARTHTDECYYAIMLRLWCRL